MSTLQSYLAVIKQCKMMAKGGQMNISIIDEVIEQLRAIPQHLQWQVLEFASNLLVKMTKAEGPHSSATTKFQCGQCPPYRTTGLVRRRNCW